MLFSNSHAKVQKIIEKNEPKINFVPSQCQKESKAVRRLERNRDKANVFLDRRTKVQKSLRHVKH